MIKNTQPLVSICCATYNHANYIKDTINSFIFQQINFPYEIIINDDASTDNTSILLVEYYSKYPKLIRIFLQKENQYRIGKKPWFNVLFPSALGKYIARCDGDDYWTDPNKLQKQVDFLEANPEYGMVCTDYDKYYQKKNKLEKNCLPRYYLEKGEIIFEDYILDRSTIGTATVLFRKSILDEYFSEIGKTQIYKWNVGDVPIYLFIALKSKIKVLPDITSIYRINENSASKFTDAHKFYKYVLKGYEIPFYFKNNYDFDEGVKDKIYENYLRVYLRYRFEAKAKEIGKVEFRKLKEMKKLTFDDCIMFYCYNFPIMSKDLLFLLSKIIRKITKLIRK